MKNRLLGAFALCAAVFVANEAEAKTWEIAAPDGVGDVAALTNALKRYVGGDKIALAPGTYDLRGIEMTSGRHLLTLGSYKALTLYGTAGDASKTILAGGGKDEGRGILRIGTGKLTCSNITFRAGYSTSAGAAVADDGTNTAKGSEFFNCIFASNYSTSNGGATQYGSYRNCVFIDNETTSSGGAMAYGKVYDSYFTNNVAKANGGAVWRVGPIVGCTFFNNQAKTEHGAAICQYGLSENKLVSGCTVVSNACLGTNCYGMYGTDVITNCTFFGNWGAGVQGVASGNTPTIVDSTFEENRTETGGIVWGGTISRCVFRRNVCTGVNVGVLRKGSVCKNCLFDGNVSKGNQLSSLADNGKFYNCTIANHTNNSARQKSVVGSGSKLVNTIIYGTCPYDVNTKELPDVMSNCLWTVQNQNVASDKVVGCKCVKDLRFLDAENGNYRLTRRSPAFNAGWADTAYTNRFVGVLDLDKNPRVYEGDGPAKAIIDIGCYECQIPAPGLMMLMR